MSSQQSNEALEGPTRLSGNPWIHEMLEEESKRTKGESWWSSIPSSTDFVDPSAVPADTVVTVGSEQYTIKGSIGRGGFGCIYRCCRQGQGASQPHVLAMKVVDNKKVVGNRICKGEPHPTWRLRSGFWQIHSYKINTPHPEKHRDIHRTIFVMLSLGNYMHHL